jgi:hypothetical protein
LSVGKKTALLVFPGWLACWQKYGPNDRWFFGYFKTFWRFKEELLPNKYASLKLFSKA